MKRFFVLAALLAVALAPAATRASALPRLVANDDKACLIKVVSPDHGGASRFGAGVAISGETMAVMSNDMGSVGRAVYVFVRDSSGWSNQQKITLEAQPACVAIQGDTLAVGLDGEVQVWTRADGIFC